MQKTFNESALKSFTKQINDILEFQHEDREQTFISYMINHINNLIFVVDKDNHFVYVNDTVIHKYGYTKDQLLTMSIGDLDINFNEQQHEIPLIEVLKQKQKLEFHSIHKGANGKLYPVFIRAHYVEYEGEAYNFGAVEDESYIQKLLDAQDGFVILSDGVKLVMANQHVLDFFAYKEFIPFIHQHNCICDFFIEETGFIHNHNTWIKDVLDSPHNDAKVKMKNIQTNQNHIFLVRAKSFDETRYVVTFTDITELENYKKKLEIQAITDEMTSLYNRRYFNKILPREINRAKREEKKLVFMMLDVDFFKQYNDTYGHINGDETLIKVAKAIQQHFNRGSDFCFRLGGEEFGVVFAYESLESILSQAEQLRKNIEELHIEHEKNSVSPYVTISIGMAIVEGTTLSEALYNFADQQLYQAKNSGRNRVSFYMQDS
ncbi:MAG: sensor domain-containing diguanylate cyclase [Thiovulaceae bacterium]|nr:sensor domain-containing diguanylate cyclase [Sulfurimonadaceae bacterium]